jgi:hypothetical protein
MLTPSPYSPAILGGGKTDEDEVENGQRQA